MIIKIHNFDKEKNVPNDWTLIKQNTFKKHETNIFLTNDSLQRRKNKLYVLCESHFLHF